MKYINKISLTPVACAALVAFPSAALADGPYVSISGGVALPEDSTNSGEFDESVPATADFDEIPAGTELAWNTEFDTGYALSGQVGYAFENGFRVEAEAAYSEYGVGTHSGLTVGGTDIDAVDVAVLTRGAADAANPTVGAVIADGQGQVSNFGLFGNVFYDIDTGSALKPYVGGGVGYQWVDVDYSPSGVAVGEDDDGAFAYQLMAGASYEVSDSVELFGQYTWRDTTEDADIPLAVVPATLGVESSQSVVSAGIRFNFGG
ncbi:P44/Msp2 family outer membrane protein [Erythrobacter sp. F6033]|uniref:outer membrane protein n=1 Tax=Erythrobacter sp. F6033 TaxID=2926401 RepID=UPI001FF2B205|nr:P44/Msp2 family outer membrane protein [Erythrobacter sp. F6033]MCK0128909.1 P44/Msp2 family outer membrane protein [Erythrobacter sp. F6033]